MQQLHAIVLCPQRVELLIHLFDLSVEGLEQLQLDVQPAAPQVVDAFALGKRARFLGDLLDAGPGPGLASPGQAQPLLGVDRADLVLDLRAAIDQHAAVVHQPAALTLLRTGHVRGGQLPQHRELGEFERIILVGLAFDARPAPRFVRRVGHGDVRAQRDRDVVYPAGDVAGLDHQQRL